MKDVPKTWGKVVGRTRESTQEDLFYAIERGDFPKWRFCVQVMPEEDAEKTPYNLFDLTKAWDRRDDLVSQPSGAVGP